MTSGPYVSKAHMWVPTLPKPNLHLVSDDDPPSSSHRLVDLPEVGVRKYDLASTALQGLRNEGAWTAALVSHALDDRVDLPGIECAHVLAWMIGVPVKSTIGVRHWCDPGVFRAASSP